MLTKEFYEKATTNATAGESGKVLDMGLADKLLKDKVKTLTPVSKEDIEESNIVDNYYQIDTDSFLYRADKNSFYVEEVLQNGESVMTKGSFMFALSYVMNRTLARYF